MDVSRRTFAKAAAVGFAGAPSYDVAVIGAGVFGSWTAYLLRQSGRSIALLDEYGPANSRASSGGESRIIRAGYGSDEIYSRWAQQSLGDWKQFFGHVNQPALFRHTGVLWISTPNDARTQASTATLEKLGIPLRRLSEADLVHSYPQIRLAPGTVGVLEPESGALLARKAVQALAAEVVRLGCDFIPAAVFPPEGRGRLDAVRTTGNDTVRAATFVFACGPWLPKVFPGLLGKRIFPTRQEAFFFGTPPGDRRFFSPAMPVWIDFSDPQGPYGFPVLDERGFKLAFDVHGPAFDPDSGSRLVSAASAAAAARYIAGRFPALSGAPLVESRVCQYENTSNGDFLIDRHPDFENVWLVGGGSGHGFKHGPAVGRYITGLIEGRVKPERRFSLASKAQEQRRTVY